MLISRSKINNIQRLILIIGSLFFSYSSPLIADKKQASTLILAVHPYLNAQELKKRFTPLAKYLSKSLGQKVVVRVGRTYDEHLQVICHDEVDIAFMGPAPYVKLSSRTKPKPLLAKFSLQNQAGYHGHIVAREDSEIQTLSDLIGKSFAFGDPNSTMSHLVPRYMLQEAAIVEEDLSHTQFLFSHRNVAHGILAGDYDAGAIKDEIYQEFSTKGLRQIALSPLIPPHLFIANSHMSTKLVNAIRRAMLNINNNPYGLYALKSIHSQLEALVSVQDSDYDQLRYMLNQISAE